jgi:hypothetical protein
VYVGVVWFWGQIEKMDFFVYICSAVARRSTLPPPLKAGVGHPLRDLGSTPLRSGWFAPSVNLVPSHHKKGCPPPPPPPLPALFVLVEFFCFIRGTDATDHLVISNLLFC